MFSNGCRFVPNHNTKYIHNESGQNQSRNFSIRYKSHRELLYIIKEESILSEEQFKMLEESIDRETMCWLDDNKVLHRKISVLHKLLEMNENIKTLPKWMKNFKGYEIAIYGVVIGKHIFEIMERAGYKPYCFIDQNAAVIKSDIPIVPKESVPANIRLVINTVFVNKEGIREYFKTQFTNIRVIDIEKLVGEI